MVSWSVWEIGGGSEGALIQVGAYIGIDDSVMTLNN